jgi:outer membrane protein
MVFHCFRRLYAGAAILSAACCGLSIGWAESALAETLESALIKAYQDNAQLNAQRASVRATDENVPQALSGYRPKVGVVAGIGEQRTGQTIPANGTTISQYETITPYNYGISASQTLFNGFQTANKTRAAESQVYGAREGLRALEQTVLLNAAAVYMDVLRDTANVLIQRSNVTSLRQVLEQTKKRFEVGDVTRTDISQAAAQVAAAEAALFAAEAQLSTDTGNYETIIGVPPKDLKPGMPADRFLPKTLPVAVEAAVLENPNVTAAMYGIDVAFLQVKVNEGSLYPSVVVQGSVTQSNAPQIGVTSSFNALVTGQLNVPLYQGGAEYSLIRQSKEGLAQQRLALDLTRRQARANAEQAWAQLTAAKGALSRAQTQVAAAEDAVNGIREEMKVGQRTTFDLLNAQQVLVQARTTLIGAQHDRVAFSYSVLSAVGRLSPQVLGLSTPVYNPATHYYQVRDSWIGVRTPSGQ